MKLNMLQNLKGRKHKMEFKTSKIKD